MVKIDWSSDRQRQLKYQIIRENAQKQSEKSDYYMMIKNDLWPVKGKHLGKPIKSLSESYLKFIIKNFDTNSEPRYLALIELEHRQHSARKKIQALRQKKIKNST